MPTKSDIISLNHIVIPTGVTGVIDVTSENPAVDPSYQDRANAPAHFLRSNRSTHDLVATIKVPTYADAAEALAWLGFPDNHTEQSLRVYGGDPDSPVAVTTPVTVVDVTPPQGGELHATFRRGDVAWYAATATTEGPETFTGTDTHTFDVGGELVTRPLVTIAWTGQRSVDSSIVGWKYRRKITVTNNGAMSLYNHVVQIGPVDTAALVTATKMQSNAADWVVFNERGERLRHGIAGTSTRAAFLSWVVDELDAGESRTYDVCYGNPSALYDATNNGFPFTYPGSPTIDITALDGQAQSGATGTTLPTGITLDDDRFNGGTAILTGGNTNVGGQYRRISDTSTGGLITITRAWNLAPNTASGYVVVSGPFMGDGGAASATSSTTLTDSSQSWYDNEWIGATVEIVTLASGGLGTVTKSGTVTANTATVLTVSSWTGGTPSTSDVYRVYKRNANHIYRVAQTDRDDTNHRGRWRINQGGIRPSSIWFASDGAPHAWSPTVYNPSNAQNDYNQLRATGVDVDPGGGVNTDWFAILNAKYQRKDGGALPEKNFANGCEISTPLGVLGILQDYAIKNPNGMCRAVFGSRDRGGEDWELYHEYGSTHSSLTAQSVAYYDLTGYGTPHHLLAALTSYGDDDIAKSLTGVANLTDNTTLEVRVDCRNLVVTDFATAAEEEVYDLTLLIRLGTNASETAGDDVIRIGQNEKHVFLADGEELRIGEQDDIPFAARIYDGSTFVRDVPWQVRAYHVENDRFGEATRYVSADVLPMTPGSVTMRVSDPDGTMGTLDITWTYRGAYL